MQVIVQAEVRPEPNRTAVADEKAAAEQPQAPEEEEEEEQKEAKAEREKTALPVLVTVLLLVPLLLIISAGLFICWRRTGRSERLLLPFTRVGAGVEVKPASEPGFRSSEDVLRSCLKALNPPVASQ